MRYIGGKSRQAGRIAAILTATPISTYVEPFLGSAAVAALVAPRAEHAVLSDASPDLIAMWSEAANGWEPPAMVTREQYDALRAAQPSALRGFAGFAVSYNGKWWGGYGATAASAGRNYVAEAKRSILRRAAALGGAQIICADYRAHEIGSGCTVYLDPPYMGTMEYGAAEPFGHNAFWSTATAWAHTGARVYVSEYEAPPGWVSVLDCTRTATVHHAYSRPARIEGLWTLEGT
jgi:DNA adenine methylase